jgi:uncharacterized membrane protein (UPF0127 family)
MRRVIVTNKTRPSTPVVDAIYCDTFLCQLHGLMFRSSLDPQEGLLLVQKHDSKIEAAIHMLFMWINLAVVWIDMAGQVVDVRLARRWRLVYIPRSPASYILEMHIDRIGDFEIGDQIEIGSIQAG